MGEFPSSLPTHTRRTMNPHSGLTYIIVNRKTRLVLDDPVGEAGSVNVSHLNQSDTQKVRYSDLVTLPCDLPSLCVVVDAFPGARWSLDSAKCQKWEISLHRIFRYERRGPCRRETRRRPGAPLVYHPGGQNEFPVGSLAHTRVRCQRELTRLHDRICTSSSSSAASLDTSVETAAMPVVLRDNPNDPTRGWTFMRTVEIL